MSLGNPHYTTDCTQFFIMAGIRRKPPPVKFLINIPNDPKSGPSHGRTPWAVMGDVTIFALLQLFMKFVNFMTYK